MDQGNKFKIWNKQIWSAWCDALLAGANNNDEPLPNLNPLAF